MKAWLVAIVMVSGFTSLVSARTLPTIPRASMFNCYSTIMRELFNAGFNVTAENIHPNIHLREPVEKYWRVLGDQDVLELEVHVLGRVVYYHMAQQKPNIFSCTPAQTRALRR